MEHDTSKLVKKFMDKYFELSAEYDKEGYKNLLEVEIQEKHKNGILLSQDDIKRLEEKYYQKYINNRTICIVDSTEEYMEKEKQRLKKQHSIDNPKNINKSYNLEEKLCEKYLVVNQNKLYLLRTEIQEQYSKGCLLKFIRLMYIYEKALNIGLVDKTIKEVFSQDIFAYYEEYKDCFEDIYKVIMDF